MIRKLFAWLLSAFMICLMAACGKALPVMKGDEFGEGAVGKNGGVSSFSEDTSQAGIDILKAGGNAIDAAVAGHE